MKKANLIKSLLVVALVTAGGTATSQADHGRRVTPGVNGTTVEVRSVANPSNRKASKSGKLIITRDASGKIISVKRSY